MDETKVAWMVEKWDDSRAGERALPEAVWKVDSKELKQVESRVDEWAEWKAGE